MGTCYICGKEHVDYRRTVHTGNSYRTGISSRGRVHTSVASHSGVRTVCASCALSIDYNAKKNAEIWYKTHFDQYVDEIDIRAKQYQLKVEEAQNERRRIQYSKK